MRKLLNPHNRSGLTLLETTFTLAIFGFLLVGIITAIIRFQAKTDLDLAVFLSAETAWRAGELSRAIQSDSSWSIKIATGTITLFKGTSFSSRDSSFDEILDISSDIVISGADEFIFARLSGTTTAGTTTLLHSIINESRSLSVNPKGVVDY